MATTPEYRLITIAISHYCEKARWGLQRAGIPFFEDAHAPFFHKKIAQRAGNQNSTPILVGPNRTITDSADILKYVDEVANIGLFPEGLEMDEFLDSLNDHYGVETRRFVYINIFESPSLLGGATTAQLPFIERTLLPLLLRMAKGKAQKSGFSPEARDKTIDKINRFHDEIAERLSDGRPYLMGDNFTAADLTFASLSAAAILPEDYGWPLPRVADLPNPAQGQVNAFRNHPAGQFALKLYREERAKVVGAYSS